MLSAATASSASFGVVFIPAIIIAIFYVFVMWKVFEKAGLPGWGAIVPIYNIYLICKMGGKPGWYVLLFFIPFVNFVISLLVYLGVARKFNKSDGFGVGLWLLGFIFLPILAFGPATYNANNR